MIVLIALFLAASQPNQAAAPPADQTTDSIPAENKRAELAGRFARAYFPADTLNIAAADFFERSATEQFHAQAPTEALEQRAPGMIRAVVAAGREVAIERQSRITREIQDREAELFSNRLSEADLTALVEIFESPAAGTLLQRGASVVSTQSPSVLSSSTSTIKAASAGAQKSASGSETSLLAKFLQSDASKHLSVIFPEMQSIAAEIKARPRPDMDQKADAVMRKAAAEYVAKFGLTIAP